jgi:hypothetical protein
VTPETLIELSRLKNGAHATLVKARAAVYTPSTFSKSTSDDRKIALDKATAEQQEAYDNLSDEYQIRIMEYEKQ